MYYFQVRKFNFYNNIKIDKLKIHDISNIFPLCQKDCSHIQT